MIRSLKIEHFRFYENVELEGLQRVNLIVGANGSGKTALLESIFLAAGGSPEIALRLQAFRGMAGANEISGDGIRNLWRDLFYGFDQHNPVKVTLIDNNRKARSVSVSLIDDEQVSLPIDEHDSGSGITRNVPIEFVWSDPSGVYKSRPIVTDNGRITFPSARNISKVAFFPAQFRLSAEETAKRLSELSKEDELEGMVTLIHAVYDDITSASVENHAGTWQTFVKLPHLKSRIPIGLYSSGASKFVSLVLGIASQEGGCVLIDEIENGFYYHRLEAVWGALYEVARQFKCQLFVTTHSMECIRALEKVVEAESKDFALLKTYNESGKGRIALSRGQAMAAALESGFEIR